MIKSLNQNNNKIIYILENEQPTTCPKCGARTDFVQLRYRSRVIQKHSCLWPYCKYVFIGEFED